MLSVDHMGKWYYFENVGLNKYIIKNKFTFLMWLLENYKWLIWLGWHLWLTLSFYRAALHLKASRGYATSTTIRAQLRLQACLAFVAPLRGRGPGSLGPLPWLTWTCRDVDQDGLESRIQFGENGYLNNFETLTIWIWHIFPIISVSSNLISLSNVLQFSSECSWLSFVKHITSYFMFLGIAIMGFQKISFSSCFPLVYKNTLEFSILTVDPMTLLNSRIIHC